MGSVKNELGVCGPWCTPWSDLRCSCVLGAPLYPSHGKMCTVALAALAPHCWEGHGRVERWLGASLGHFWWQ